MLEDVSACEFIIQNRHALAVMYFRGERMSDNPDHSGQ